MEASKGLEGVEYNLTSPQLPPSDKSGCLVFWYHMYGSGTGSLTVLRVVSYILSITMYTPFLNVKYLNVFCLST